MGVQTRLELEVVPCRAEENLAPCRGNFVVAVNVIITEKCGKQRKYEE